MDWHRFSKEVGSTIASIIDGWPKQRGLNQEQRVKQRRLRDSTLLSLSLLAKESSFFWLTILKNDVEISISGSKSVLSLLLVSPSFFKNTRSLRLELSHLDPKNRPVLYERLLEIDHPALSSGQAYALQVRPENEPLFVVKFGKAYNNILASVSSLIIDAMPNLEELRVHGGVPFQFVRLRETKGVLSSRIIRGFSNLKILDLRLVDNSIAAKNTVWLLIFLENLTHLRAYFKYLFKDEKFLLEHQEVLSRNSKVTHLDLTGEFIFDPKKRWPNTGDMKGTQLMGLLLQVTKNLIQLKLHVPQYSNYQVPPSMSLSILSQLRSSLHSLKHLALHGAFKDPPSSFEIGDPQGISIHRFEALETLSVDFLPISAFRQFCLRPDSLNMKLFFPNLKTLQFFSSRQESNVFAEQEIIQWINSTPSYFKALEQVLCSKNPIWFQEQTINLSGAEAQWISLRKSLRNLCNQKGLKFTLLEDDEQMAFATIPDFDYVHEEEYKY